MVALIKRSATLNFVDKASDKENASGSGFFVEQEQAKRLLQEPVCTQPSGVSVSDGKRVRQIADLASAVLARQKARRRARVSLNDVLFPPMFSCRSLAQAQVEEPKTRVESSPREKSSVPFSLVRRLPASTCSTGQTVYASG
jgi:hypothetical protein